MAPARRAAAIAAFVSSLLGLALGMSVFALPVALLALATKIAAITALVRGDYDASRNRFGVALALDIVALLAWVPGMIDTTPRPAVLVGMVGLIGTWFAWTATSRLATAARLRWGADHRSATGRKGDERHADATDGTRVAPAPARTASDRDDQRS